MGKKFDLSEQVRKELEQKTNEAGKALEVKEKEIQDLKEKLRQAKEVAIREYRDSDALLGKLGGSSRRQRISSSKKCSRCRPENVDFFFKL